MFQACPECGAHVASTELGDLVTYRCSNCSFEQHAWVARVFPEMPRSPLVSLTLRLRDKATAAQLKTVRAAFSAAASMTPSLLQTTLNSATGFVAAPMAFWLAKELVKRIEAEGLLVERNEIPLD